MSITGEPGGEPLKVGVAVVDVLTGLNAAAAILAALNRRDRTGDGERIELSLLDSAFAALVNVAENALVTGEEPVRYGNAHPSIVPYQTFSTADGGIAVAAANDGLYRRLCAAIGRPELADDERYATNGQRVRNREALVAELESVFAARSAAEWLRVLLAAGVPAGEIRGVRTALASEGSATTTVSQRYLPILAASAEFLTAARELDPVDGSHRAAWTESAHADFLASLRHKPGAGALDVGDVMQHLRERLPADAILTNGAGNYTVWCHRFYAFRRYRTQLAPCSSAMGYSIPAAIAAKVVYPERTIVCVSSDGDFLMSGHELATAVQEELPVVVLVVNNGMYGTIRMHQERLFPGRVVGTDLVNPDFAAWAHAFGAYGEVVLRSEDFAAAFERALAQQRPALLELRVDSEAITPSQTLSQIRAEASATYAKR